MINKDFENLTIKSYYKTIFIDAFIYVLVLLLLSLANGIDFLFFIFLFATIFSLIFNLYTKFIVLTVSENIIEFDYFFKDDKKEYDLIKIERIECYCKGFNRPFNSFPYIIIFFKNNHNANKKERIVFIGFSTKEIKKLENLIKSKNIQVRFVHYMIGRENEILPEDT